MYSRLFILLCLGCVPVFMQAQSSSKVTISGYIEDTQSSEKLLGATVYDSKRQVGVSSNTYGFYSLTLPANDTIYLTVSYLGYETQQQKLLLKHDTLINVKLGAAIELQEVEINAEHQNRFENSTQMSRIDIPIKQIKSIPALLGEVDVLKALQLLPGVQSGSEGTSGLYVRGGSPDQNLILLDGVPVYNASHLFGFFSVFNPDAIKDVSLIKGGFPARYGGRLSSVLEINMKEGNQNEFHGEGSIGLVASKLTLEGPIAKGKTSFIVSARRTYVDILAQPLIWASSGGTTRAGYYFYDINAKVNHKFSENDRLFFSIYGGNDRFYVNSKDGTSTDYTRLKTSLAWGNITSALRWNHLFNNKLFANTTLTYSRYRFGIGASNTNHDPNFESSYAIKYRSGIEDWGIKTDFDYVPSPSQYIRFGGAATLHSFTPGATSFKTSDSGSTNTVDTTLGVQLTRAAEFSAYIEDEIEFSSRFKVNGGVHLAGFIVNGKFYASAQPRIAARYMLKEDLSLKASFSTMQQYIHLLVNEGIGLPTDLWVPTTARVKPETSWQGALGLAKTFRNEYEISVEGYYKRMNNVLSYQEGANFLDSSSDWQDKVSQGSGDSYGAEFLIQKKEGKFTGWIGYTLAWNWRKFADINGGERYPFKYDRRHDISVVASYQFTPSFRLSATWVFGTGQATTLADSRYYTGISNQNPSDGYLPITLGSTYSSKNNYRLANYHRLDIGMEFTRKKKIGKRHPHDWQSTWAFGAYNAYSRQNPFFIYLTENSASQPVFKQVSLFPIIPYINYSFKF